MSSIEAAELLERIKQRCEDDFKFFVRYFFKNQKGSRFKFSKHHEMMCDKLMDVYHGRTTYLIINLPPRYSKTELCVKMFSAWCFVKNPKCEFIHLSYSDGLALDNSDTIKQVIKSFEFQQLWPHITVKPNKDSKKAWGTEQSGCFYATAAGGQVTGYGAGKIDDFANGEGFGGALIIDDPLKPDDAHSEPKREGVNKRWDETIKNRRNSNKTPVIIIMQRIHQDDFCGMLLGDEEFTFEELILNAIVDEGTPSEHALWPEKHTLDQLKAMSRKNSYVFSAQYQQRPSPLGGGIIKSEWFERYTVLPQLKYRMIYVDTAQKAKQHNDYQVAECWGLGKDGNLYLIDVLRKKFQAYELEVKIPDFWNKHKALNPKVFGPLRRMNIEDKVSGTELIQKIQKKVKPRIPVKGIPRGPDSNKLTRVMDIQGYIESRYVHIPENAPWVHDFVTECEEFTANDTHSYDDQIDPMCDAISDMLHQNRPSIADIL